MEELEDTLKTFCHSFDLKFSPKTVKNIVLKTEMDLMITLDKDIISNYLQGYSVEEISIKSDKDFENINKVIDCYNYLYN